MQLKVYNFAVILAITLIPIPLLAEVQLYHAFLGKSITRTLSSRGVSKLPIVYQSDIDPDNNGTLNTIPFVAKLKSIPNNSSLLVLDWEGFAFNRLIDSKAKNRKIIQQNFISASELTKSIIKDVNVGYYGLPSKKGTWQDRSPQESNLLKELYSKTDALYPSLYLKGHNDASFSFMEEHLNNTLRTSLEHNKKVYVFITHRWHPNSKVKANLLIPKKIFRDYINIILNTKYQGKSVDGIIWWGADEFWYNKLMNVADYPKRKKHLKIMGAINRYTNFDQYIEKELLAYKAILTSLISNAK